MISTVTLRYETFLSAITGLYFGSVAAGARMPPVEVRRAELKAYHWLDQDVMPSVESAIRSEVPTDDMPVEFSERIQSRIDAFLLTFRRICLHNIDTVIRHAKGMSGVAGAMTSESGAIGVLLQKRASKIDFKVRDSANRLWASDAFVSLITKDLAYQCDIDVALAAIRSSGEELAVVAYANPEHANNGLVFSINQTPGHPTLESIRPSIFHPNSTAMVRRYVQS